MVASKQQTLSMYVSTADINLTGLNPRKDFNEEALGQLSRSIASHGIIEPLVVRKGLKACSQVSSVVRVTVSDKGLQLKGEGDTDTVTMDVPVDQLIEHECKEGSNTSKFSHEYLYWANNAVPKTLPARFEVGNDYPLVMRWEIAEGHGSVVYLLAPRIAED